MSSELVLRTCNRHHTFLKKTLELTQKIITAFGVPGLKSEFTL